MKKKILAFLTVCALTLMTTATVHAQTTVVVQRPGLLSGLVDAAEALLLLPIAVAEGVVVGTVEAADAVLNGTTTVYTTPAPVVVTPAPVVAPAPVVVAPAPVQTTTVTRTTTVTTVVRPTYEVIAPRRHVVVAPPAPVVVHRRYR